VGRAARDRRRARLIDESTRFLGLSYDDPASTGKESVLRYDACITVAPGTRARGLARVELPGGRHAVLRHRGPYELIGHSFDWMISTLVLTERVEVRDARPVSHYTFLDECLPAGRVQLARLCNDAADRRAIHDETARLAAAFFTQALGQ
jgi:AraC family transcriptional regulator